MKKRLKIGMVLVQKNMVLVQKNMVVEPFSLKKGLPLKSESNNSINQNQLQLNLFRVSVFIKDKFC